METQVGERRRLSGWWGVGKAGGSRVGAGGALHGQGLQESGAAKPGVEGTAVERGGGGIVGAAPVREAALTWKAGAGPAPSWLPTIRPHHSGRGHLGKAGDRPKEAGAHTQAGRPGSGPGLWP